jgi:transcriptional regulator with XRE-family HTH domain
MPYRASFASGRHVAAARALAGLTQNELASLAGLHVNSLKRIEQMLDIRGSCHAVERIGGALRARGILAERWPTPYVRIADSA